MEKVLRRILSQSISEFETKSVYAGKESLMWIVDWYRKLIEYTDNTEPYPMARKKRMLATLEIIQREVRILSANIDRTIISLKNNR